MVIFHPNIDEMMGEQRWISVLNLAFTHVTAFSFFKDQNKNLNFIYGKHLTWGRDQNL